jgi:hypothetical protein
MCCKLLAVHELDKEAGTWCPHVLAKGCGIYESRPGSCRTFVCLWLAGFFAPGDRPDRSKVVAALQKTGKGSPYFMVYEARDGVAAEQRKARAIFRSLWETGVAVAVKSPKSMNGEVHTRAGSIADRALADQEEFSTLEDVDFGKITEESLELVLALRKEKA